MAKTYTCRDVGVDCDWSTSGATQDEVMASISEHAAKVHPTIELTPELVAAVRGAIKDDVQTATLLQQLVGRMVVLERQIEEAFVHWLPAVQEHAEATQAVGKFQTMVKGQREELETCLHRIGGSLSESEHSAATLDATQIPGQGGQGEASGALHAMTAAFNDAAFGYTELHTVAHRFNDRTGEGNAADMVERHQRSYMEATQTVYQLIPDVALKEMGANGEFKCTCPSCSLGLCLCWHTHIDSLALPSPADEGGILVRAPKANSAASAAGLRSGDVILAVGGQKVQTYQELQAEIRKLGSEDQVGLQMLRESGSLEEIAVTCPR